MAHARNPGWILPVSVALLTLGFVACWKWYYWHGTVRVWLYAVFVLPGCLMLVTGLLISVLKSRVQVVRVTGVLLALMSLPLAMFAALLTVSPSSVLSGPEWNSDRYSELMRKYSRGRPCFSHFPKSIPPYARNVRLYRSGPLPPGEDTLILAFTAPAAEAEHVLHLYERRALTAQHGTGYPGESEMTAWFPYRNDLGERGLPKDYKVLKLKEADRNCGWRVGIAASLKRNRIIYWAQQPG